MKRILKFRGYSTDLNKWVYGSLVNNMWTYSELTDRKGEAVCEIITGEYDADCWEDAVNDPDCVIKVLPESVGQFTGLHDMNGKEIYEGDIYKTWYSRDTSGKDIVDVIEVVEFEIKHDTVVCEILFIQNCKIIGNIHQNPELLPC